MNNLPERQVSRVTRLNEFRKANTPLWRVFLIAGWVLLLHLGFAGLILVNTYLSPNWYVTRTYLFNNGTYFGTLEWLLVYIPAFIFLYGLYELWPYIKLFRNREDLFDAKIYIMPRVISNLHMMNSLGLLGFIISAVFTTAIEDKTAGHIMILLLWGSYIRIGGVIGKKV